MRAAQEKFDNLREGKLEFAKGSVETNLLNAAPALSAHSGFILETRQERLKRDTRLQDTLAGGARNQTWAWP